jgi:hypothetical protein
MHFLRDSNFFDAFKINKTCKEKKHSYHTVEKVIDKPQLQHSWQNSPQKIILSQMTHRGNAWPAKEETKCP